MTTTQTAVRQRSDAEAPSGRLTLQPLLDVLPIDQELARSDVKGPGVIAQAAAVLGVPVRLLYRYRDIGMNAWTADRVAIAAGLHPLMIWGDDWAQAAARPPTRAARAAVTPER